MAGSKRKRLRKDTDEAHAAVATNPTVSSSSSSSFSNHLDYSSSSAPFTATVETLHHHSSVIASAPNNSGTKRTSTAIASTGCHPNHTTTSSDLSPVADHLSSAHSDRKSVTFDRSALKTATVSSNSRGEHPGSSDRCSIVRRRIAFTRHKSSTNNRSRRRQRSRSRSSSSTTSEATGRRDARLSSNDQGPSKRDRSHSSQTRPRHSRRKRRTSASQRRAQSSANSSVPANEGDLSYRHLIHFATGASASKQRRRERQRSVVTPAPHEPGFLLFDPSLSSPFQKPTTSANPNSAPVGVTEQLVNASSVSLVAPSSSSGMRSRHTAARPDRDASHTRESTVTAGSPIPTVYLLPSSVAPLATGVSSNASAVTVSSSDVDPDEDQLPRYVTVPGYPAAAAAASSSFVPREHSLASIDGGSPIDLTIRPSHQGSARSMAFMPHLVLHGAPMQESTRTTAGDVMSNASFPSNSSYQALHDANLVSTLLNQASFAPPGTPSFGYSLASAGSTGSENPAGQCNQTTPQAAISLAPLFAHQNQNHQHQPHHHHHNPTDNNTTTTITTTTNTTTLNIPNIDCSTQSASSRSTGLPVSAHQHHPQILNPLSMARLISLNQPVPTAWSRSGKSGNPDVSVADSSNSMPVHVSPRIAHQQQQQHQSQSHPSHAVALATSHTSHLQPPASGSTSAPYYYCPSSGSARAAARHAAAAAASSMLDSHPTGRLIHGSRSGSNAGRHSPHTSGINHRISQLQLNQTDRSVQLILLQDINQILLMGFEETLINLNVHGLVRAVLEILECEDDTLIELKTLGCNVLTHMMDTLPRSSDAVVPALPLLLTTMSSSFVGDILERIINLLDQLSRRHGREVLKSGAISAVLGFYDFVTLAQHRTILSMVSNCFVSLQPGDFPLLADSLPSLAERLKESEPRCVERVCTCFARLVLAYRAQPDVLRRIVSSCNLFANLQHLLMASPPILSGVRDVVHMLAILCSSCPYLAVDLIKQNISSTLHCILTGEPINSEALQTTLLAPIPVRLPAAQIIPTRPIANSSTTSKRCRSRSGSGSQRKHSSSGSRSIPLGSAPVPVHNGATNLWPPLILVYSPLSEANRTVPDLAIHQRSQDDIHGVVQLICEFLPPVPASALVYRSVDSQMPFAFNPSSPTASSILCSDSGSLISLSTTSSCSSAAALGAGQSTTTGERRDSVDAGGSSGSRGTKPQRSESDRTETCRRGQSTAVTAGNTSASRSHRHSEPTNHAALTSGSHRNHSREKVTNMSCSSVSSTSSETLRQVCLSLPHVSLSPSNEDPRAALLYHECEALHAQLQRQANSTAAVSDEREPALSITVAGSTRRRSSGRQRSGGEDRSVGLTGIPAQESATPAEIDHDRPVTWDEQTQALQLVQTLLPLLFELFTETTKLQTRLRCLEAIQRMLFYSSPVLLAKVLRPRHVCSHIVGMLNSPEKRILLAGLHIALMLVDRIPPMFASYFRKEGILHQVEQLRTSLGPTVLPSQSAGSDEQLNASAGVWISDALDRANLPNCPKQNTTEIAVYEATSDNSSTTVGAALLLPDMVYRRVHSTEPSTPVSERPRRSHHTGTGTAGLYNNNNNNNNSNNNNSSSSNGNNTNNRSLNHAHLTLGAVSTPALLLSSGPDELTAQDTLSSRIVTACEQLQSRVTQLVAHLERTDDSIKGAVDGMDDALAGLDLDPNHVIPSRSTLVQFNQSQQTSIDLMPKLTAIATHLGSTKPALWVFAFAQLIELLRPSQAPTNETPSPFELQQSGVSVALLHYLTEPDRREIRLWILYRMFFGARASSDVRLLSGMNLIQLSRKQATTSKNWPLLLPVSPVLLDPSKTDQLREVDRFLSAQLSKSPDDSLIVDGPDAFHALIQCVLACFHRHEHFQVSGVPPLLPADSKLLSFLQTESFATITPVDNRSSEEVQHRPSPLSIAPNASIIHSSMADSSSTSLGQSLTSASISRNELDSNLELKGVNSRSKNLLMHSTHLPQPAISQLCAAISRSRPVLPAPPAAAPQPGFLCIDLVQLTDPDELNLSTDAEVVRADNDTIRKSASNRLSFGSGGTASPSSSSSATGRRKDGRKSSASSVASSNQTNCPTVTNEAHSTMPGRFSLQISALATLQNLERLLMQRTYVSQLIQEGLWNSDHDYGLRLSSFIGAEQDSAFRDDEFRGLLDVHVLDEDSDPAGTDGDESENHVRTRTNNRHRRQTEDDEVDLVVVVEDEDGDQNVDGPSEARDSRGRYERTRGRGTTPSEFPVGLKRAHLSTATGRGHRRAVGSSSVTGSHSRRSDRGRSTHSTDIQSHNSSETCAFGSVPIANRTVYPSLFSYSPITDSQTTVETRASDGTTRGLRTLLQRTPHVSPAPQTDPDPESESTIPVALRPVDTRGSRRRSLATSHSSRGTHPTDLHSSALSSFPNARVHTRSHADHLVMDQESTGPSRFVQDSQPVSSAVSHSYKPTTSHSANPPATNIINNNSSTTRHRRLKGSSILAAFGALANLSTTSSSSGVSSGGTAHGSSATGSRSGNKSSHTVAGVSHTPSVRRTFTMHRHSSQTVHISSNSSAQSSSSSSASSMSPHASPFGRLEGQWTTGNPTGHPQLSGKYHRRPCTVQFYVGGHRLPINMALFEAVRRYSTEFSTRLFAAVANAEQLHSPSKMSTPSSGVTIPRKLTEQETEDMAGHLLWSMTHTIYYRLVYTNTESNHHQGNHHSVDNQAASGAGSSAVMFGHRKSDSHLTQHVTGLASRAFNLTRKISDPCPSPPAAASVSIGTCLKRRRPDADSEVNVCLAVDSQSTSANSPGTTASGHPLFSRLSRELPRGFLTEVRCTCATAPANSGTGCSPTVCTSQVQIANGTVANSPLNETVSNSLALLRALHNISRLWYTVHDALDPFPIVSPLVFRSPKLAIKAGRQLQDVFSVLAGNLPTWLVHLIAACPFLFPFEVRRTFFYAYHFDRDRTLLRFQDTVASSVTELEQQPQSALLDPRGGIQLLAPHSFMDGTANSLNVGAGLGGVSPRSGAGSSVNSELSAPTTAFSSALSSPGSTTWMSNVSTDSPGGAIPVPGSQHASTFSSGTIPLRPQRLSLQPRGRYATRITLTPSLRRHKVTVHRDGKRLLRQAEATLADLLTSRAVLEIAFDGEVGFGLGPTLEFYTLVSRQLMKASLGLWHGNEVTADGYVIAPPPGLYPRPLAKQARSTTVREVRSKFLFLGRLMARALLDGRQLDLPFSPAFFKWFLGATSSASVSEGHILPNDIALVDPELGRHVRQLTELANRRQGLQRQLDQAATSGANAHLLFANRTHAPSHVGAGSAKSARATGGGGGGGSSSTSASALEARKLDELRAALMILDNEVEDLCLNFVLPGYEIELLKNGSHIQVTGSNLGDYLRLVTHWLVIEGASRQMESVLEGFDSVLPNVRPRLAILFQPDEMEGLFCGRSQSQFDMLGRTDPGAQRRTHPGAPGWLAGPPLPDPEGWDVASLTEACRCDHGYTPQSRTIRHLFEVMSEFNEQERRLFLQFVTGSPRLPVGGFRALKPPLKIVMKRESGENADNHLPSVMTCQNYLKLPDYSTKELLASKLRYAIHEGQNAFHLS